MKILITGAKGQLGSEINNISSKYPDFSFDFYDIDTLDVLNTNKLDEYFNQRNPDCVVNCAAYTNVDNAETNKKAAFDSNCRLVSNLITECKRKNVKFIHMSTDYVFDGHNYRPYIEDDPVNPQGEYGKTKLLGEQEALKYDQSVIIRTSWLYSSYGNNFVKTIIKLAKDKDKLNVIYDQIGTPTNAADLAYTILEIIQKYSKKTGSYFPGIYHYSNEGVCSWYDFAKEIVNICKLNCKIVPIESKDYPTLAKRPHYSVLNKNKIKTTYGISIPYWRDSLKKCLDILVS